jgi:Zn-dependent protease with chaperone function
MTDLTRDPSDQQRRALGESAPFIVLILVVLVALGLSDLAILFASGTHRPDTVVGTLLNNLRIGLYGGTWALLLSCAIAAQLHRWRAMRWDFRALAWLLAICLWLNLAQVNSGLVADAIPPSLLLAQGVLLFLLTLCLWSFYDWIIDSPLQSATDCRNQQQAFWWVPPPSYSQSTKQKWHPTWLDYTYLTAMVRFSFFPNVEPISTAGKLLIFCQLFTVLDIDIVLVARAVSLIPS